MEETAPAAEGQAAEAAPEAQGQATESQKTFWYDTAPDELKGYIQNKGWDDPVKAANSYRELEKFQGASPEQLIKLPKDGESMDEVYDRLGRPKSPGDYELQLPEDNNLDEGFLGKIQEAAHIKGINSEQLNELVGTYIEYSTQVQQEQEQALMQQQTAELEQLKGEWGNAFDERAELGRRFVASNLPEGVDKASTLDAIEKAIGTATMLKMFANSGSNLKESKLPDDTGDKPFGYSREQALSEKKEFMQTIQADPDRLANYNKGIGPDIDKLKRLNKIVAGQ